MITGRHIGDCACRSPFSQNLHNFIQFVKVSDWIMCRIHSSTADRRQWGDSFFRSLYLSLTSKLTQAATSFIQHCPSRVSSAWNIDKAEWNHLGDGDLTAGLTFTTVGDVFKRLSRGLVSGAGVYCIVAWAAGKVLGSMMERSAAAVMLRLVQRYFEIGLWFSPRDASTTLSKDLFFGAIEGRTER